MPCALQLDYCFRCGCAQGPTLPKLSTAPTLNTSMPFSFTRRHTLRPTCGPPYFQNCCCQVNIVFVSKYPWIQLRREPLIESSFMSSSRMVPLWVVQLLPTSPGDPTSGCDQNEGCFRQLVPIQRDRGAVEFQRMRYMGFIAKMFECIGSK